MGSRLWSGRHPGERVSQPLPVRPLSLLAPLFLFSYNSKKIALPLLTRFSTLAFPEKKTPFLRGEICPSRQSRRECKISCQRCKFLHFHSFFVFFLTKTVKIRWNWRCKIFSLKIRGCKILDKFHVWCDYKCWQMPQAMVQLINPRIWRHLMRLKFKKSILLQCIAMSQGSTSLVHEDLVILSHYIQCKL